MEQSPKQSTRTAAQILFAPKLKKMKPTKPIRKAKLNARWRIFHGNKAYAQKIKMSEAFYKFYLGVMKHDPEIFA